MFAKASGRAFSARIVDGREIIDLFDEIGPFGVSAGDFQARMRDVQGPVTVRINSPGGDVFDGLAIFNALATHPGDVRVEVVGVAASAASVIAMAGDTIAIADNAFLMVHRAWGLTVGNTADHAEAAALLDQVDGSMVSTYAKRTGQPAATIKRLMADETWLGADAAIEAGFADEKLEPASVSAHFDLSVYAKAPAELVAPIERNTPTIRDVEAALRSSGFSWSQARALAEHGHRGDADEQRAAAAIADLAAHISAAAQSLNS
jgi:ATP-dependent protease ClpP protease subunit